MTKQIILVTGASSARGGTPPLLAPYFAAKAGMYALAISYAGELARWGSPIASAPNCCARSVSATC